jgi:hypothetical protein
MILSLRPTAGCAVLRLKTLTHVRRFAGPVAPPTPAVALLPAPAVALLPMPAVALLPAPAVALLPAPAVALLPAPAASKPPTTPCPPLCHATPPPPTLVSAQRHAAPHTSGVSPSTPPITPNACGVQLCHDALQPPLSPPPCPPCATRHAAALAPPSLLLPHIASHRVACRRRLRPRHLPLARPGHGCCVWGWHVGRWRLGWRVGRWRHVGWWWWWRRWRRRCTGRSGGSRQGHRASAEGRAASHRCQARVAARG